MRYGRVSYTLYSHELSQFIYFFSKMMSAICFFALLCLQILLFATLPCLSDLACNSLPNDTPVPENVESVFDWELPVHVKEGDENRCERCGLQAYMNIAAFYAFGHGKGRFNMTDPMRNAVEFIVDAANEKNGFISLSYNRDTQTSFHAVVIEGETLILQRKERGRHYPLLEIDISNLKTS